MKSGFKIYQHFIKTYPLFSNAVQTAALMATGDIIAQVAVERRPFEKINFKRTAQFASLGFILVGPTLSQWYRLLSKLLGNGTKSAGFKKVALDQLCFAPCFMFIFLNAANLSQGYSLPESIKNAKKDYPDVLLNNYRLWPAVQILNFNFVPLHFQVLVVQTVAIFWNIYLSWKTQEKI